MYNARTPYPVGVIKLDEISGDPLEGVVFGLYGENIPYQEYSAEMSSELDLEPEMILLEELPPTDAVGFAQTLKTYAPGIYYLREISTINGYEIDTAYHAVTVAIGQAGGAAVITVENSRTAYPVGVYKIDEISEAPLEGVVFGLYNDNSPSAILLDTFPATDASGYAQSTKDFAPGTYFLKEITTINGYVLDTLYHNVVVAVGQAGGAAVITVDNARTAYPVGVNKVDAVSSAPLQGVIFALYNNNTSEASLLETLPSTDIDGYAQTVKTYVPGTYYLKEISTISGYDLDPAYHAVLIGIGQAGGVSVITVENAKTPVPTVSVLKTVQNITTGIAAGKTATGTAGDDFLFTILAANTGETVLTDVIITDSEAVVGSSVTVDGILTKWSSGTDGAATITLESLAVDKAVKITYSYDTDSGDLAMSFSNVVLVDGAAPPPLGRVTATDTATITITAVLGAVREPTKVPTPTAAPTATPSPTPTTAVLGAARTGETDNGLVGILAALLLLGASGVMLIRMRSSRKSDAASNDNSDDPDQGDI